MLVQFGYDEVDAEWDQDPELAQRRYEMALRLNALKGDKDSK
jgi:hypothetical protein